MTQSIQHSDTTSEDRNDCVNRCFPQQDLVTSCKKQERQACHVLCVPPFIDFSPLDSITDRLGNVKVVHVKEEHQRRRILYLNSESSVQSYSPRRVIPSHSSLCTRARLCCAAWRAAWKRQAAKVIWLVTFDPSIVVMPCMTVLCWCVYYQAPKESRCSKGQAHSQPVGTSHVRLWAGERWPGSSWQR